jgi:hypothetical protein
MEPVKPEAPQKTLIYRRPIGKRTVLGSPADTREGDLITFFVEGRYTTREVRSVNPGKKVVVTKPLTGPYGTLDHSQTVSFSDIDEIIRLGDVVVEEPQPPEEVQAEAPPSPPKRAMAQKSKASTGKKPGGKSSPTVEIRLPGLALRPGDPGYERAK